MKRIHSKDDIVQTGLAIIYSKGFNATGVEAILKQANVPKGSFYNFFSSKEEFGLAIIDRYVSYHINPKPLKESYSYVNDTTGTKYGHSRIYYDGGSLGVLGKYGQVTKQEAMKDGASYSYTQSVYGDSAHPWLLRKSIDQLGRETTTAYDSVYFQYPILVSNPKGQRLETVYDFEKIDNLFGVLGLPVMVSRCKQASMKKPPG